MKKMLMVLMSVLTVLSLTSCNEKDLSNKKVAKIKLVQGGYQTAFANQEFKKEIMIKLFGSVKKGLLGGKGSAPPVSGIKVLVENVGESDLTWEVKEYISNPGGTIRLKVKAGSKLGDQYLKITTQTENKKSITIRLVTGIKIFGAKQECITGHNLDEKIKVEVKDSKGKAMKGVPVYFSLKHSPEKKIKAKVGKSKVLTNNQGIAEVEFKMGKQTGTYSILTEIASPQHNLFIRGLEIKEMGVDLWGFKGLIIVVLGGLAIFVLGMKEMSNGLNMIAGEKMKSILQIFARNRFVAVIAGALVTGVIQSSSACTVMVVGFVNAGLLTLTQAIGIVFGANIGTTITAQMIALKLDYLALPSIIIGLVITMLAKKNLTKGWGYTFLGFGLLFFGMKMMSGELKLIGKFPTFIEVFKSFDCSPIDGTMPIVAILGAVFIGTLMTVVVQSSSASMGIVLALAAGGLINFYTAVPLLLGTNIGTTITAILASIGANERAKQAAVAHVLFNLVGTIYMVALFYIPWTVDGVARPVFLQLINSITDGNAFAEIPENLVTHIAMGHTFFNIFNVLLFLPFFGVIDKLCNVIIKIKDEKNIKLQYLESHLLDAPAIALEQTIMTIRYMTKEAWKMVGKSMNEAFLKEQVDEKLSEELREREEKVDELQEDIADYLVNLTQRVLSDSQSELIPLLMHCSNDAEKIADHTANILSLTKRISKAANKISEQERKEIGEVWAILENQAQHVISCLENSDKSDINFAIKDERKINKMTKEFENAHIKRLRKGECDVVCGIIFIEILSEIEKIGDCFSNIAERSPEIQKHHIDIQRA